MFKREIVKDLFTMTLTVSVTSTQLISFDTNENDTVRNRCARIKLYSAKKLFWNEKSSRKACIKIV